ncbi:MAG: NAD-dependent epimerase/dehydratase family protein [Candidatus Woesearchaeota archaeon]|nr:NAD-dependent epimerase/dehydratase family protein [Candidatus Woesearchaeota archaeon]
MKIFITGAAGFVGAYLTRYFLEKGHEIHILLREQSDTWRLKDIVDNVHVHHMDIRDEKVREIVKHVQPDAVIHTAVYGGYHYQQDQGELQETIMQGTMSLIEACKELDCVFVNTGSSSEYGKKQEVMKEDMLLEPNTPYGVFKAATTLYCQHMAREHSIKAVTLRLFSVYGYDEQEHRLFPTVLNAYAQGKTPTLSSPDFVRDFIFLEDVAAAYEAVLDGKGTGQIFNVCSGKEYKIADVVHAVREHFPKSAEPTYGDEGRVFEPAHWRGDHSKLTTATGWQPRHSLAEGVKKTLAWNNERA